MKKITFGFSPCPNDTYIFYALVNKKIDLRGLDFEFIIKDVEILNQLSIEKKLDISKVSSHAYSYLQDDYEFLSAGAAFGRGCGPLIVAKNILSFGKSKHLTIAVPGRLTTAFLLLKLFLMSELKSRPISYVFMPFNEIMRSVHVGDVDAGVIIHEGRFTYRDYGLSEIADLGEWWEKETGLPIPLGGIIAKKVIGGDKIKIIEDLIRKSVKYSSENISESLSFIKNYSQELAENIIMQHIALYVNSYSIDIGDEGQRALNELLKRAGKIIYQEL